MRARLAGTEAEAERRIVDLRLFEADYRDRMRNYLKGLLAELDRGSAEAGSDPADFRMIPVFGDIGSYVALDCKHCTWRSLKGDRSDLGAALADTQHHVCRAKP